MRVGGRYCNIMTMMEIVESQHGVLARWQARSAGVSRAVVASQVRRGVLEALSPRVLRLVGAPRTARQHQMAGVLDAGPGAVASHSTAATLWGIPGFGGRHPEVSRLRGTTRRPVTLASVHEPRLLPCAHVSVVDAIPVTTPERTLCDLAACVRLARLERAADSALAARVADLSRLWLTFDDLAATGRPGRARMGRVLGDRPPGYTAPESELEARFMALVAGAGLEQPHRQVEVGGADWVGRVDFLFRHSQLVVEVDGQLAHSSLLDRQADARRDAALRAAGFDVLRFGWADVVLHPRATVGILRRSKGRLASETR